MATATTRTTSDPRSWTRGRWKGTSKHGPTSLREVWVLMIMGLIECLIVCIVCVCIYIYILDIYVYVYIYIYLSDALPPPPRPPKICVCRFPESVPRPLISGFLHHVGFQIPDFQTCTPQASRDYRFQISRFAGPRFSDSRSPDLHDLCFQIPDSQICTTYVSRFQNSGNLESGNMESGNIGRTNLEVWNLET